MPAAVIETGVSDDVTLHVPQPGERVRLRYDTRQKQGSTVIRDPEEHIEVVGKVHKLRRWGTVTFTFDLRPESDRNRVRVRSDTVTGAGWLGGRVWVMKLVPYEGWQRLRTIGRPTHIQVIDE